ncbi:MAG: hypothetical protein M5U33_12495 [Pseudorhodoplanes sp.]|nr:hypothetical protein [Pseudorhodoplanes sp.]
MTYTGEEFELFTAAHPSERPSAGNVRDADERRQPVLAEVLAALFRAGNADRPAHIVQGCGDAAVAAGLGRRLVHEERIAVIDGIGVAPDIAGKHRFAGMCGIFVTDEFLPAQLVEQRTHDFPAPLPRRWPEKTG